MCGANARIDEYKKSIRLDESVSPEQLGNIVANAVKDRGLIFYFVWRALQDMHPELDADEVMMEASRRFGSHKSKTMGNVETAADALLNQTSKTGMLAFNQEIKEISPERSEKHIRRCPHIEAFDEVGCTKEEKIKLCTKLLMPGDYAILNPFQSIRLEFPKNLAADDVCIMVTKTLTKEKGVSEE
ncbi:MAG: hypothetical protein ACC613_08840 [Synergistales bacterium]